MSFISTISRVKIKNGNITGTTLYAQTEIAFKQEFEQTFGLKMKNIHKIISSDVMILFDFKILVMYNIIIGKGKIWKNWH